MDLENLKYPIGKPVFSSEITETNIQEYIAVLSAFPKQVKKEISKLNATQLAFRYRPEGWTIHQVVAHCLDSHMNSFIRFKLALTEDNPTIKPYEEARWAQLDDTLNYPIEDLVQLLDLVHKRWVFLLQRLHTSDFEKTFVHPDGNEQITLKENLLIYAWHCKHHLQHIKNAKTLKFKE